MGSSRSIDPRYFTRLAAAYVRGHRPSLACPDDAETLDNAVKAGLRIHRFKRTQGLRRVDKVLGVLRGLKAESLLDVGSGRGVFLWPLLDAFPGLSVTAMDRSSAQAAQIGAVARGGVSTLRAVHADACALPFKDCAFEIVTALEVMEHIPDSRAAACEIVRVARRFVVASVPSRPDDNPEHLQLFTRRSLEGLWLDAGAARVQIEAVLNHFVAVVRKQCPLQS